ncbi:MAG: dihydroorotase [Chitinophagales bacterium]|nr:dihydroorotase [Chitinophagales bacterium]
MNILIRSAKIIDKTSSHHLSVRDIFIEKGIIREIGKKIEPKGKCTEIRFDDLHVSKGWIDLNSFFADPGLEHKETIESGCSAAAAGGFTHVCILPNTEPVADNKAQIEYVLAKAADNIVKVLPIGAVTKGCRGNELAELYDMHLAGAVAFSDGALPSLSAGLLERALEYVKAFNGVVFVHPEDSSISGNGVVNEGVVGTMLGLPQIPSFAEELAIARDLMILEYTQSRLHFLNVSLKNSVDHIVKAKKKGLNVTVSINAHHLLLSEDSLENYNTLYKVNPPLRSRTEVKNLIKAVSLGFIDSITAQHYPHEEDSKNTEFDKAAFGIIGLETAFAAANTALHTHMDTEKIIELFSDNPRKILGLQNSSIETGYPADLTLFSPNLSWTFTEKHIRSKSKNTPFIGKTFVGKSLGIVRNGKLFLS